MAEAKQTIKYYDYRHIARIIIEASTPIAVGTGEKNILTDSTIAFDVNGLPYIPGTAIAGVVRHAVEDYGNKANTLFGYQDDKVSSQGQGSEIIFSEARMVGVDGEVIDGLVSDDFEDEFYRKFKYLPIRQHVKIDDKGVAEKHGKFDQQVVYKGTRFCFEIEIVSKDNSTKDFENILQKLQSNTFRLGGGTRKGYGEVKVISIQQRSIDLTNENQRIKYIGKSSTLRSTADFWENKNIDSTISGNNVTGNSWVRYELKIVPVDFFLFGSGYSDEDANMTPVKEDYIVWDNNNKATFQEQAILIPASSVKGAILHRTRYHFNRLNSCFADRQEVADYQDKLKECDTAIAEIFGTEGSNGRDQKRGNVIMSDIIENKAHKDKILNHVAIDRFTGGSLNSALFSEKTTYLDNKEDQFVMQILVKESALKDNDNPERKLKAFESALQDICESRLPLGGGVNRGNGYFTGKCYKVTNNKNKEEICTEK